MATLVYTGPANVANRDVGAECGEGDLLIPGKEYDVSKELAELLSASSPHWKAKRASGGSK